MIYVIYTIESFLLLSSIIYLSGQYTDGIQKFKGYYSRKYREKKVSLRTELNNAKRALRVEEEKAIEKTNSTIRDGIYDGVKKKHQELQEEIKRYREEKKKVKEAIATISDKLEDKKSFLLLLGWLQETERRPRYSPYHSTFTSFENYGTDNYLAEYKLEKAEDGTASLYLNGKVIERGEAIDKLYTLIKEQ